MPRTEPGARDVPRGSLPGATAMIAHDLRAPLRQVMDLAALAAEADCEAERRGLLEDIRAVAARTALLLDHLLTLGSDGAASRAPLSLRGAAEAAAHHHRDEAERLGGEIVVRGEARIHGDGVLIEQLFRNLIGNAVKYRGDAPPRVLIALEATAEAAVATVTDRGLGIPRDRRAHVFEPFARAHAALAPGHGIGLALCRQVAEAHGGTIDAAAPRGGEATRIIVALPRGTPT